MPACSCGQGRPNLTADWDGIPRTASAKCLLLTPSPGSTRRMQTPAPGAAHGGGPRPLRQRAGAGLLRRQRKLPCRGKTGATGRSQPNSHTCGSQEGGKPPSVAATYPVYPVIREQPGKRLWGLFPPLGLQPCVSALSPITQVSVYNSDSHSHPERTDFSSRLLTPPISLTHPPTHLF